MYRHYEDQIGWNQTLANKAFKALKKLVVDGQVPPDTRLDPRVISDALKTSVTPVREALIHLEAERYIVGSPKCGYYTMKLDAKHISDQYGVIKIILQDVFRGNVDKLQRRLPLLQTTPNWDDHCSVSEFLESFCERVAETTNNGILVDLVHESNIRTRYFRWLDLQRPERLSCIRADASELLQLLDKRDKSGAIANLDRQFSAISNTLPELVLEGNDRAGNTKESWLEALSLISAEGTVSLNAVK
ncbi:GntR family transcriptional regulator [Rhizobium leguminosarum]|uniref:GntR family transcriptional regulator n=1 Tax=Rhizobium leguminosarum TaxID=384 RepID=UPI0013B7C2C5|nr:GntR family transcriptional regulator [Rhizobium leguminosarum]NEI67759.1 GntR family transcriptional regulator [Rhizobium leguminosarum]